MDQVSICCSISWYKYYSNRRCIHHNVATKWVRNCRKMGEKLSQKWWETVVIYSINHGWEIVAKYDTNCSVRKCRLKNCWSEKLSENDIREVRYCRVRYCRVRYCRVRKCRVRKCLSEKLSSEKMSWNPWPPPHPQTSMLRYLSELSNWAWPLIGR